MDIEKQLDNIRASMMYLAAEADDRAYEPFDSRGHHLRIFVHLAAIERALVTLTWILKREEEKKENAKSPGKS